MATELELKERQRIHLGVLLKLKRENKENEVKGLNEAIENAVMGMDAEDVEIMEKRTGVKVEK